MGEVILNLPLTKPKRKSKFNDLFEQITDGRPWKVGAEEFAGTTTYSFRLALRQWAYNRGWKLTTRTDEEGNVYVQRVMGE